MSRMRYPCPCCGYLQFGEPPGSYEICDICFWEDDAVQLRWPTWAGGANRPSLIDAQIAYARTGVMEERLRPFVRAASDQDQRDAEWRAINPSSDNFEARGDKERPWPDDLTTLYWWRPTFWRASP